ncbi:hypothetical protein ASPVEDRAFT_86434 [Aspergillus versicolor CBS 583.65]|uniref:Uncharacterized protein n=1 Tax=Aspergillus versicolor CBS 583.65 TaxID=1036611 RepID=A0A1L9PU75_ASPVE|nr:uncharacterized protein ASPVEDRAFT_86434 [Aspergillus versicolor CBS 583.65]OJJ05071.1 hypothetical protein ASPVEDRAFT_86434 [Aspergillus versicolor CBS 583.65]
MSFRIRPCTQGLRGLTSTSLRPRSSTLSYIRPLSTTPTALRPSLSESKEPIRPPTTAQERQEMLETLERQILSPERAETAYSGTDNEVGCDNYAYDPSITNPEGEFQCFEEEVRVDGAVDPLFISPANRDFSQMLDPNLDGRAVGRDKGDRLGAAGSVRGWVKKGKEVKIRQAKGKGVNVDEYERLLRGLRKVQMRHMGKDATEKPV